MRQVTARPAALARFTDQLIGPDAALADRADDLRAALFHFQRANPDFGRPHTGLDEALAELARHLVELDRHVGLTGAAFEELDGGGALAVAGAMQLAAEYGRASGMIVDLRDLFAPMPVERWSELVFGDFACLDGVYGTYRGGGAITGPDGQRYPVVVPELYTEDGVFHVGHHVTGRLDPATLGGVDVGWTRVATRTGVARVRDAPATPLRVFTSVGTLAGGPSGNVRFADQGGLAELHISPTGVPFISAVPRPMATPSATDPVPAELGESPLPRLGADLAAVGATARHGPPAPPRDRAAPDRRPIPRPERAAPDRQPVRPRRHAPRSTAQAGGAVDLAINAMAAAEVWTSADHGNHAAYQIVFERTDDGRRRAMVRTYQVVSGAKATIIDAHALHLSEEGMERTRIRYSVPETAQADRRR